MADRIPPPGMSGPELAAWHKAQDARAGTISPPPSALLVRLNALGVTLNAQPLGELYTVDIGTIERKRGSNVIVKSCVNKTTDKVCVVKVINYKHMDFDESAVFNEIEALVLAKEARDPEYLAQYVDLFTSDGKLELVIAYWAEIAPLYDAVIEQFSSVSYTGDSQPFTEEAASKIIRSVLRGIKQLHDQDIVHCNLSPDTIFVNPSDMEQVYLADLSSATVCPPERFLTNQAGTPGYAAPEQLQLDKTAPVQFGRAADIWSVGVTMYQLLCGRPPFSGDNADAIKNVQEKKLVFDETWKRVSEKAMDLLKRKLLVRDPASRPNVAELLEDPWFTGAYFRTSSKKGATAGHDGGPSDTISGSVRRLHLSHAKRKLRAAIRVAIAQHRLKGLLVGLEREEVLLQIGIRYTANDLLKMYALFDAARVGELKAEKKKGMPELAALKAANKIISKDGFCGVIMKILPDIVKHKQAAVEHFMAFHAVDDDFEASQALIKQKSLDGVKATKVQTKMAALAAQRTAMLEVIDYREYIVSLSTLCMRADPQTRIAFVFNLFDEDGSGTIDKDEFAALISGMMISSSMTDEEMRVALAEDFERIDSDGDGVLSLSEFTTAAAENYRLKTYFDNLARLAKTEEQKAISGKEQRELRDAATSMQSVYRGWKSRKEKDVHKDEQAVYTRDIVFSHPVFSKSYDLSMPITKARMDGLKKLFALADLQHLERMGPGQFQQLLLMLRLDLSDQEARKLFKDMDADDGGFIEFDEFAESMLENFDDDVVQRACDIVVGAVGTRMWDRGEVAWSANTCCIFVSFGVFTVQIKHFDFILIPLLISYFLTFLMGPMMDALESRPIYIGNDEFCKPAKSATRIKNEGTAKASLYDCIHSCKVPHGISVLVTLFSFIAFLAAVIYISTTEFTAVISDEAFMHNWNQLTIDVEVFLNDSGLRLADEPELEGYTLQDVQVIGSFAMEVFNQVALVLLLTVYIMATRGEGGFGKGGGSVSRDLNTMIEHYIKLKTALSLCTGVIVAVILLACQVKLAVVFGVLTFLLNYIPNIGSVIATILPIPIILVDTNLVMWQKFAGIILPATVQMYVGNALEPSVFGKSLNLTPISILIGLVMWGSLWGIPGAVLSVPLLGIQKILMSNANHPIAKGWLALIREDPTVDETGEQDRKQRLKAEKRSRANDPEEAEEEEPFELEKKRSEKQKRTSSDMENPVYSSSSDAPIKRGASLADMTVKKEETDESEAWT